MIKEIQYQGYATASSDYECSDGQLALSLNLIAEDEQLKPVLPPAKVLDIPKDTVLMYIHETSSYRHIIYKHTKQENGQTFYNVYATNNQGDTINISSLNPHKVKAIGNILILLSSDSTDYFLFKDNKYNYLGNRLPDINLTFSLKGFPLLYSVYDKSKSLIEVKLKDSIFIDNNEKYTTEKFSEDNKKLITDAIMAAVNKFIQEETIEKERFLFPFFVRYAYRLYDGNTVMASAPILMTPNTMGKPLVFIHDYDLSPKINADIFMTTSELQYRFLNNTDYSNWKDIIKSIDVYVSKPIYGYKQDGDIERFIDTNTDDSLYFNQFIGTFTKPVKQEDNKIYYHPRIGYDSNIGDDTIDNGPIFIKHVEWNYKWIYYLYFGNKDNNLGELKTPRFILELPALPEGLNLEEEIENTYIHYKVATIDPYIEHDNEWRNVPIKEDTLKSLVNRDSLNINYDYLSHERRILSDIFEYNSRIHSFASKRECFNGFPAQSMFQYVNSRVTTSTGIRQYYKDINHNESTILVKENILNLTFQEPTNYEIYTIIEDGINQNVVRSSYTGALPMATFCNTWDVNDIDTNYKKLSWPSFFYYPNTNAKRMVICNVLTDESGNKSYKPVYSISLKPHEYLNGAFARLDFRSSRPYFDGIAKPEVNNTLIEEGKNKILTSEVNNPFLFPLSYVTSVGDGEILGISTAAQALSQGQFGQFPLYAFTTDGVWALQVSDKGTFSSRQPISRDVCTNKDSITQLDKSVVFATDRGIMIIEGSKTSPITDAIFTNVPFDVTSLQHIDVLHKRIGHDTDTCIPTQPFSTYMKGCRLAYDYTHQRIYVYNPSYTYAYVFSLKSKMWGMVEHNFSYSINSYPDTKIVTKDNMLLNLSSNKEDYRCGMFITSPLKLDSPNVLKTITTIIQRGHFQRGDVSTVLYGSRDLYTWHLIWSSKDHYLRGFRGTPYKYFRIAGLARLTDGKSIFGATIQYTPRLLNQPR